MSIRKNRKILEYEEGKDPEELDEVRKRIDACAGTLTVCGFFLIIAMLPLEGRIRSAEAFSHAGFGFIVFSGLYGLIASFSEMKGEKLAVQTVNATAVAVSIYTIFMVLISGLSAMSMISIIALFIAAFIVIEKIENNLQTTKQIFGILILLWSMMALYVFGMEKI
jgi:hypothetical protein